MFLNVLDYFSNFLTDLFFVFKFPGMAIFLLQFPGSSAPSTTQFMQPWGMLGLSTTLLADRTARFPQIIHNAYYWWISCNFCLHVCLGFRLQF